MNNCFWILLLLCCCNQSGRCCKCERQYDDDCGCTSKHYDMPHREESCCEHGSKTRLVTAPLAPFAPMCDNKPEHEHGCDCD